VSDPAFLHRGQRTFTEFFMRTAGAAQQQNLREQDPAEVLRGYADRAAATQFAGVLRAAYSASDPTRILAATTAEQDEEEEKREKAAFLLGNVAGT
jgi:hypothetical protein